MDIFEKINRAFGGWYEGLFGSSDDVRPRDILRRILTALEENRKEGFDNKVYVPNQFILEIAVDDPEEKDYLLAFLDRDELETAVNRYCKQNNYHVRGALDFTIHEVEMDSDGKKREKVRVRCKYTAKISQKDEPIPELPIPTLAPLVTRLPITEAEEDATVGAISHYDEEEGTVPAVSLARLNVKSPGKAPFDCPMTKATFLIGRSAQAGNDLILQDDGMVSRRHARIEREQDGSYTIYDLDTTNGTKVNGSRITNVRLYNGDTVKIGSTNIEFVLPQDSNSSVRPYTRTEKLPDGFSGARLVLTDGTQDLDAFILATVTVIGRAATNDICLDDRSVATRHARIVRGTPYTLDILDGDHLCLLNGSPITAGVAHNLKSGDRIGIGTQTLRYEEVNV